MAETKSTKSVPFQKRPFAAILVALIFIQTVLVECCLILWPSLPLSLIPAPWARRIFSRLAGFGQAAWLGSAVTCSRFVSKSKIYIHCKGMTLQEMQQMSGDSLMISNHPSRIDWMFHWAVAIASGRLANLKIVLKDALRVAPGFGWAMQCNSYPFVCRKDRNKDLETSRRVSFLGGGLKLASLSFPEGTDLSDSNSQKSHAHAEKEGLSKYTQVSHPRTAGFETASSAMMEVAKNKQAEKPSLLDITVAYVHQVPGELPSEVKFFGKGECVEEVHMSSQRIPSEMDTADAGKLCTQLWKEKEEMLCKFYAPCQTDGKRSGNGSPDPFALAADSSCLWEDAPGAKGRIFASIAVALACESITLYLLCTLPLLSNFFLFLAACVTFVLVQKLAGGIDKVILHHADKYPEQFGPSTKID